MPDIPPEARVQFEELHAGGINLKDQQLHALSLDCFVRADEIAMAYNDDRKRLDALNPMARALWSMERYDEALDKLTDAADIAEGLDLVDERAITVSNIGRLTAIRTIKTVPVHEQAEKLRVGAVPFFQAAFWDLSDHPHLYYRYANSTHGSVVAALAGERKFAWRLIKEGRNVAHEISPEPYDQKTPAEISPAGLKQLRVASYLIALGNQTPVLAAQTREQLIR